MKGKKKDKRKGERRDKRPPELRGGKTLASVKITEKLTLYAAVVTVEYDLLVQITAALVATVSELSGVGHDKLLADIKRDIANNLKQAPGPPSVGDA